MQEKRTKRLIVIFLTFLFVIIGIVNISVASEGSNYYWNLSYSDLDTRDGKIDLTLKLTLQNKTGTTDTMSVTSGVSQFYIDGSTVDTYNWSYSGLGGTESNPLTIYTRSISKSYSYSAAPTISLSSKTNNNSSYKVIFSFSAASKTVQLKSYITTVPTTAIENYPWVWEPTMTFYDRIIGFGDAIDTNSSNYKVTQSTTVDQWTSGTSTRNFSTSDAGKYFHITYYTYGGNYASYVYQIPSAYTLSYNTMGGSSVSSNSAVFTGGTTTVKSTVPTKTGYTFAGWYTGANGTGTQYSAGDTITLSSNVTLYAKWTANTYTVKYNGNGSTSGSTASSSHTYDVAKTLTANGFSRSYTVTYNHNYTGSTNTTKTATYSFSGWATSSTGSKAYDNSASVTNLSSTNGATVNLYAVWTSSSVTYVPSRTGYIFGGWYTESSCTTSVAGTNGVYTPTANITLYAKWTAITYTVKYNGNGSTSGSTASSSHTYDVAKTLTANGFTRAYTVTYNHNYTGSTNTTKTATYSFAGWATSSTGSKAYDNSASVTNLSSTNGATVNLYAVWTSASVTYVPTRTGYIFGGWYTESSCTTSVAGTNGVYTPTANITLYAKWTAITYTVKYNGNGSTSGSTASSSHTYDVAKTLTANGFSRSYTVTYNHNYTGSTNTTKTATYSFAGWAASSTGSKAYDNSASVTNLSSTNGATVNLYAVWTSSSVTYVPSRTGYIFGGWYTESSCTTSVAGTNGVYTPTANITLYAKWTAITYTVKYNGNGSTSGSTASSTHTYDVAQNLTANGFTRAYTVTYNHNYTGSTNTTKTATYSFSGWAKSSDGVKAYADIASVTNLSTTNGATVNLYAVWTSASVTYVPTRTGYTFGGWYSDSNCTTQIINTNGVYTPTSNITLYAKWTINSYKVTYNYSTNGGTTASKTEATVNYNSAIDLTPTATKSGWTFVGWNTNKDATTKLDSLTMGTSNVTLYAIYKKDITATVKYYNNQTSTETKTIYNTATSTSFTLPTIASQTVSSVTYTGRGYSEATTANATVVANSGASVTLSANKTYYANYSAEITGTFYYYNGSAQTSTTAKATRYMNYTGTYVNSNFTVPTATALSGYTQRGWSTGTAGTSTITSTPTTANTKYYMSYSYTVTLTYNANGGSLDSIITQTGTAYMSSTGEKTGASITITSAIPTRTGYTFGNAWNTNQTKTGTSYTKATAYSFTSSATLYAEWTANTDTAYVVKHWQQNIGADATQNSTNYTLKDTENKKGTSDSKVTPAVKTYTGFTAPTAQSITISADGTTVLNYYYTRKSYSVTLNKGTGITAVTGASSYQYGASVTIDATVANGYTWSSWSGTHSTTTKQYTFTMPASNVTDTANTTINSYTLTVNPNKGTWESSTEGQNFTLDYLETKTITNPNRTGYTFTGWTLSGTASTLNGTTFTMGYANATLTANWTANTYTVKYDGNGATSGSTADSSHTYNVAKNLTANGYTRAYTVTYNHNYTGSENTSKTATYSFAGWATTSTGTKKYDDKQSVSNLSSTNGATVNLYALWNSSSITYVPTRTGYTFGGWYTESSCTTSAAGTNGVYTPTANITLYAKWTANTDTAYVVKHWQQNIGAGSEQNSTNYTLKDTENKKGTSDSKVTPAVKTYTGFTAPTAQSITISADGSTVLNYYYTRNSYSVTLNKEAGITAVTGAGSYQYGASVTIDATVANGYTWSSWSGTHSTTTKQYAFTMPASNVTDTANVTANTYTVKYNGNGSTSGSTADSIHTYNVAKNLITNGFERKYTVTYNHNYTGSTNITKTATYSFIGWSTSSTSSKEYDNSASVINLSATDGAIVNLYAVWTSASLTYVPTRTGYTFGGWFSDETCTKKVTTASDTTYTPTENITLYAKWTANTYTVKYNGNGSTSGSTADSSYTYDVAKNLTTNGFEKKYTVTYNHNYSGSTDTTKTATYSFVGWSTSSAGLKEYDDKQSVSNLSSTNGDTVNLYAVWNSSSVTYVPTREGYEFAGWYTEKECINNVSKSDGVYTPEKDITLYAKWVANSYIVRYNGNGATSGNTEDGIYTYDETKAINRNGFERKYTVTYNHNYKESEDVSKTTAYIFRIWNSNEDGTGTDYEEDDLVTNLASTEGTIVNLYAQWIDTSITYVPTRFGYKFAGWYTDASYTNKASDEDGIYIPSKDITLYAKWEVDQNQRKDLSYTVEFYINGEKQEDDTEIVTKSVQVLEPDTLPMEQILIDDKKYSGYQLDTSIEIPETVENGGVVQIHYKNREFSYKVEYYYNGYIDDTLTETAESEYLSVINDYEDKVKEGYCFDDIANYPLTVDYNEENNVIKVYYKTNQSEKKQIEYQIVYYQNGNIVDKRTVTRDIQLLLPNAIAVDKALVEIDRYNDYDFIKTEPEEIPEYIENGGIINVYYASKTSQVIVKYIDKVSGESILDDVIEEGIVGEEYSIIDDEKIIDGYNLIEKPEEYEGIYTEENQEKVFYYAKNATVDVKYLEQDDTPEDITDNTVLADEEIITGYEGKEYETKAKEIENYELLEIPANSKGTMQAGSQEVIYYYVQKTRVTVNYIDILNNEIIERKIIEGIVGDSYSLIAKDFEGYILIEEDDDGNSILPENSTGTMIKEEIIINYYYKHISQGVIEKHIDKISGEILDSTLYEGNEQSEYNTSPKEFEGYDLVEKDAEGNSMLPENASGTMTQELIEVKYYYVRKTSVKVEYLDRNTGEEIAEAEVIEGHEGDEYTTNLKEIENYFVVESMYPENANGTMTTTVNDDGTIYAETKVVYYYAMKSAGVVEKHIDKISGEILEENFYEGLEGDSYTTNSKEFEGYDLVEKDAEGNSMLPENASGTMQQELIEVNYYYLRKASVKVQYIDEFTNEVIEEVIIEGHESDFYKAEEKTINNYKLDEENLPENSNGTMEVTIDEEGNVNSEIVVKYYYKRVSGGVVEKHIDIKTDELIEEKIYSGNEGDSYKTTSLEFEDYDVVEIDSEGNSMLPENAEGTMTIEQIEVNYYYLRKATVRVQYVDNQTGKSILEDTIIDGHEDDKYKVIPKEIKNYKLVEEDTNGNSKLPENSEGTMKVVRNEEFADDVNSETVVTYYYEKVELNNNNDNNNDNNNNSNNNNNNNSNNNEATDSNNSEKVTTIKNHTETSNTTKNDTTNSNSNNSNTTQSNEVLPATGDTLPVIAIGTIIFVIFVNIVQIVISRIKKK